MKKKQKGSKALLKARAEHEKFLKSAGLHLSQIKERKKERPKERFRLPFEGTATAYYEGTTHAGNDIKGNSETGNDRSLMANLYKEPDHVQKEVRRKAAMCEPAYSKGAVQYCPNNIRMYGVK